MFLCYTDANGNPAKIRIGDQPITIGRSPQADITLSDEKVSRLHCGISREGPRIIVRDLKSKNGTYLNGERVDSAPLQSGDVLRVGSTFFTVEEEAAKGPQTILHEVADEMAQGKGYSTLLREIVEEIHDSPRGNLPNARGDQTPEGNRPA